MTNAQTLLDLTIHRASRHSSKLNLSLQFPWFIFCCFFSGLTHKQTRTDYMRQLSHCSLKVSFGLVICEFILVHIVVDCHNTAALIHCFPNSCSTICPLSLIHVSHRCVPVLSIPNALLFCQRYFTLFLRPYLEKKKKNLSEWTCLYN